MERLSSCRPKERRSKVLQAVGCKWLKLDKLRLGPRVDMWWAWKRLGGNNILSLMDMRDRVGLKRI
jgi:hypothetical protein